MGKLGPLYIFKEKLEDVFLNFFGILRVLTVLQVDDEVHINVHAGDAFKASSCKARPAAGTNICCSNAGQAAVIS